MEKVKYRQATAEDVPGLLWLIQLLAEDENLPNSVMIGKEELLRDGFGSESFFKVILAELETLPPVPTPPSPTSLQYPSASMEKDERLIGYALYFHNYSTWEGLGLYLEDLYIRAEYRNRGYGTALMKECAKVAKDKKCTRMVWQCLDWNTEAMKLYERVGGKCVKEWLTVRMYKPEILAFADSPQLHHD